MIYFTAGNPWIDDTGIGGQGRCPVYCYGTDKYDYGLFVFDTTYRGADANPARRAHEIAVFTAMALTMAAQQPGFNVKRFIWLIDGQL